MLFVRVCIILSITMKRLDRVTAVIGRKQYSLRTEKTYRDWIVAFLRFHRDGWDRRHTHVVA